MKVNSYHKKIGAVSKRPHSILPHHHRSESSPFLLLPPIQKVEVIAHGYFIKKPINYDRLFNCNKR